MSKKLEKMKIVRLIERLKFHSWVEVEIGSFLKRERLIIRKENKNLNFYDSAIPAQNS